MTSDVDPRNTERDEAILAAASQLALLHGLGGFTRGQVATLAGVSPAGVSNYGRSRITNGPQGTAGVLDRIRNDIMSNAVERADLALLAVGVAARHSVALSAPDELRVAAVAGV